MKKTLVDLEHDRFGMKAIFHAFMGVVILFAGNILASLPVDLFYSITKAEGSMLLTVIVRPLLEIAVILLLTCLYIKKILKLSLKEFRICKPQNIAVWLLCSIALPLMVSLFFVLIIPGFFAASGFDTWKIRRIVLRAVFSTCLAAGITEELLFRGLIMRLLEKRWNKTVAVLAPSVLFGLLHILNMEAPNGIDITVLVIAGTAVGVMFSLIAMQSGSIWASAMVHGIWNLAIIGGIFQISAEPSSAIFTYTLASDTALLTGGAFGIEASLPAVIGYGIIIVIALIRMKNTSSKKA